MSKQRNNYSPKSKKGYVYILTNRSFPEDLLKIGQTTHTPEKRAWNLYEKHTGVPEKFNVSYKKYVSNCELAEEIAHKRLDNYRLNQYREFFKLPLDQAIKTLEKVVHQIEELYNYQAKSEPALQMFEVESLDDLTSKYTPKPALEEAIERSSQGEFITYDIAKEIIDRHKVGLAAKEKEPAFKRQFSMKKNIFTQEYLYGDMNRYDDKGIPVSWILVIILWTFLIIMVFLVYIFD